MWMCPQRWIIPQCFWPYLWICKEERSIQIFVVSNLTFYLFNVWLLCLLLLMSHFLIYVLDIFRNSLDWITFLTSGKHLPLSVKANLSAVISPNVLRLSPHLSPEDPKTHSCEFFSSSIVNEVHLSSYYCFINFNWSVLSFPFQRKALIQIMKET